MASATPLLLNPGGVLSTTIRPCYIGYGSNGKFSYPFPFSYVILVYLGAYFLATWGASSYLQMAAIDPIMKVKFDSLLLPRRSLIKNVNDETVGAVIIPIWSFSPGSTNLLVSPGRGTPDDELRVQAALPTHHQVRLLPIQDHRGEHPDAKVRC